MSMAEQGCVIVNGQKVEGRTLSFDEEGLKVGSEGEEKVIVPNEFDFAETYASENEDFVEYETPRGKIRVLKYKKKSNKKLFIAVGAALCAGIAIGGVIFYRKKCK